MQRALRSSLAAVLLLPSFAQEPITAKLNEHALFSRLGLVSLGDTGNNVRFLAEPPKRPSDTHNPAVEELFAPWLAAVDATFVASYVTPNTLERRGDVPEIGVVMLANGPSFSNAQRYETRPDHLSPKVMWLEHPGVIVGMWTERMQSVPADELRRPVIQRLIERTFVSYYKGSQGAPVERWVVEGVGGYLSACGPEETPADLRNPPADAGALERTLKFKSSPATESLVLPLAVLVENNEPGQREQVGGTRVREAGAKVDRAGIHQLWRDQASLWVHYFERGEGGRHLTGWRHYVAKVLHDNGSLEELASTLGTPVGELEEGFLQHLELLAGGEDLGGGALELSEGTILHPGLAPPAADADAILADALGRASLGELDGALSYLEAGMRVVRGADKGRVATERDRMRVVRETRGAFLADSIKNKRRLRWTTATGESVSAEVTGLADGLLTLGNNKADRASMPVEELSADDLARSLGSKVADHGPEWVGPYLLMLAGDKRWDRKLDADSAEGAALAAASELPPLAKEGLVRARLAALARTPLPEDAGALTDVLATIQAVASENTSPSARAAREGLRALATQVIGLQWDGASLDSRLKGKVTSEGGGKIKITYDFDDEAELEDFAPVEGYLQERREKLPKLGAVDKPGWSIRGGNLEGIGPVALRHLVSLEAPIMLEYELLYGRAQPGKALNATILMAVCEDGGGGYVGAWDLFDLDAIDPSSGFVRTAYEEGARPILAARTIEVRLEHSGRKAILKVGGEKKREIATGRRDNGTTMLWINSDAVIAVRKLVIRGTLSKASNDPAKAAWVAEELAKLGL